MLAIGFLNPWALWLLPLAAIPIVIHLLNRRRFDRVRWAAMSFLLAAIKRNRRRMRMEQWIVLLLRTLAVLLLVLLVSRPRLDEAVFGSVRKHHVVCIDDSASMEHRGAADTAFADACDRVQQLVSELVDTRDGDLLTVLRASDPEHPILPVTRVGPGVASRVREELGRQHAGDGRLDPTAMLEGARKLAAASDDVEAIDYYFVTDLRKVDWLDSAGGPLEPVVKWVLDRDPERENITLAAVGSASAENLAITNVACRERVCTAGLPLTFSVDIQNRGFETSAPIDLTIEVDERTRSTHAVPPLGSGETKSIEFAHTFHRAGPHGISASLPEDRFPPDSVRALALEVRDRSHALVVDGDPGDDIQDSETYCLHAALEIRGAFDSGIEVRLIGDHELADVTDEQLAQFDMVWLCNVARPPQVAIDRLTAFVKSGGGLVVFAGNQMDIPYWASTVWAGGEGILTNRPTGIAGDIDAPKSVHLAAKDDPLFASNTEGLEFDFERLVPIGRWVTVEETPGSDRRVLLRVGDDDGPPLLVSRDLGRGRLFFVATSADTYWNYWPSCFSYPLTMNAIHRTAARPQDLSSMNLTPSGVAQVSVDAGRYRTDVSVARVGAELDTRTTFSSPPAASGPTTIEIPMGQLDGYGLFEVTLTRHDGSSERRLLSRGCHVEEGRLERLSTAGFANTYPKEVAERVTLVEGRESDATATTTAGGGDTWRWVGLALLAGMLIETVLAWRFGRR